MGFVWVRRVQRFSLGSLHLQLSLNPSISLSVFQTKREKKNKKERSGRKNEENKRIKI
jgi:hypothetical protein